MVADAKIELWLKNHTQRFPKPSRNQGPVSTSVSSSPATTTRKRSRAMRRWVIGISAVVISLVLFVVVRTQGFVSGREFSPTHFQQRDFSFYEIPVLHLQITPIRRRGSTPSAATYIRQNSLIKIYTGVPENWHLVSISRGMTGSTPRDAKLLMDQLAADVTSDSYWRKWSIDHTKEAKIFWPVIQKLAERELYILMPELFELTRENLAPDQFQTRIDQILQREYKNLIEDMQDADRTDLADQLRKESLEDF